jgi:hypothetical protein
MRQASTDQFELVIDALFLERLDHDDIARPALADFDKLDFVVEDMTTGRRRDLMYVHFWHGSRTSNGQSSKG